MTLYREWRDLRHFRDPDRITTEAQRLDISQAIRFRTNSPSELKQIPHEQVEQYGVVRLKEDFVYSDDEFEAMEVNAIGHVTIWTKKYVYGIIRDGQTERFRAFPRNPPDAIPSEITSPK